MVPLGKDHILAVVRNISDRKKLEQEKVQFEKQRTRSQKLQTIGTLAGGIAHDFNNMLTPILGYSDMILSRMSESDPLYSSISEILQASNRAKELVLQMLSFSREVEQEKSPIQLSSIIKEVLKLIRSTLPETIHIETSIQGINQKY